MNNQQGIDQYGVALLLVAVLIVCAYLLWWGKHDAVVAFVYAWRGFELKLISTPVFYIAEILKKLHLPAPDYSQIVFWKEQINSAYYKEVRFSDLCNLSEFVGRYISYLTGSITALMAVYVAFFFDSGSFKNQYSMKSLREAEIKLWPQMTPIMHLDLRKEDLEKGVWAMGKRPLDFCIAHGLVEKPEADELVWRFNKSKSQAVFAMQMGPLFRSPLALPMYMQSLFVIFTACAIGERDVADKLIDQISRSSKKGGKINFTGVTKTLEKYMGLRLVSWLASRHAYVYTYISGLLELARSDGVLASSEFLWLKALDRRLWFMLNGVGRQTAIIEVAAPFAHFKAEKRFKCALRVPMIQEAIKATDLAIKEILYIREEDQWHNAA